MSATPLERKLRLLIEADGPMSVADYMRHCLGDPAHGYYAARDPFGVAGDFTTAPEISQMFGEIVGAWLIEAWRLAGSPARFRLVELGPGRGTLMADVLRVAQKAKGFCKGATLHLVETSRKLRERQAAALGGFSIPVSWHDILPDVPPGPLILVANEFFDALPINQFVRVEGSWRERVVGIGVDGRLAFGVGAAILATGLEADEGAVFEARPTAEIVVKEIAQRIVDHGGAALVIDYGYEGPAVGDTLQAVRRHRFVDPLGHPGEADLTAHVDFSALARAAGAAGAVVHGPIAQGEFLLSLGLLERAGRLGANADETGREALRAAAERLAGPETMGKLFKVLAITNEGMRPPPFVSKSSAGV